MPRDALVVFKAHDNWASGRQRIAREHLWKGNKEDPLDRAKSIAVRARYLAQCGHDLEAISLIGEIKAFEPRDISVDSESWISNTSGFIAYESLKNFSSAKIFYENTLKCINRNGNDESLMLEISSYWRLSAIELALGNHSRSNRLLDIAESKAQDLGRAHMLGVLRLASGFRNIALSEPKKACDDFLKGLFQVDYVHAPLPIYLHAELMLGLVIAEAQISKAGTTLMAVDRISALEKITKNLKSGRGHFVTPYANIGNIHPGNMLGKDLARLRSLRKGTSYKALRIIETAASKGGAICSICRSINDLTIDHIIPKYWGGTDMAGNLRIVCGKCNSRKQHFFRNKDNDAYNRLISCMK